MDAKEILLTPTTLRARLKEPIILKPGTNVPHLTKILFFFIVNNLCIVVVFT
ncbi:hypothetical protein AB1K81_00135 [Ornithinibacillus sp. 179-J 7C1 HS]